MNAFLASLVVIVVVSFGAVFALDAIDRSAERVYSVPANVRL